MSLEPGTTPGTGALRPEYLISLGEHMEEWEMTLLHEFGIAYVSGDLPPWFYRLWLTLQTVAPYKNEEKSDVRPL